MSKQDDHFFNVFSAVLGILVAITIGVFVFARILGGGITESQSASDPLLQQGVAERIKPFGQVAVAGKDNAALAIAPPPGAAAQPAAAALPASGEEAYNIVCAVCHGAGIGGAPKVGVKALGRGPSVRDHSGLSRRGWGGPLRKHDDSRRSVPSGCHRQVGSAGDRRIRTGTLPSQRCDADRRNL